MFIPRTFLEFTPVHTRRGWQATAHIRPKKSLFTVARKRYFPTEYEAQQWLRETWATANLRTTTSRGRPRVYHAALWVSDCLIPTAPYAALPELRITGSGYHGGTQGTTGSDYYLGGTPLATNVRTGADLKRGILAHPLGRHLTVQPCERCGRMPVVNLREGTLEHRREGCPITVSMPPDLLTPPAMQIALWNRFLRSRRKRTKLDPMTRPHFMILGALREPSERDLTRRIRGIEVM